MEKPTVFMERAMLRQMVYMSNTGAYTRANTVHVSVFQAGSVNLKVFLRGF
jgi:hypothetical protein